MKKRYFADDRLFGKMIGAFFLMAILIVSLCMVMIHQGKIIAEKEVKKYLSEVSQQTTYKINERIRMNLEKLNVVGDTLSYLQESDVDAYLDEMIEDSNYGWIGVVNEDGIITNSDGKVLNIADFEVVQNAFHGSSGLGENLVVGFDGTLGALYAVPYQKNGNSLAIVGWVSKDTMKLLMNTDTFQGTGFSHIVDTDGTFILRSQNKNALHHGTNFFHMIETQGEVMDGYHLEDVIQDMKKGKTGEFRFYTDQHEERVLIYTPLLNKEWYLCSVVPPQVYAQNIASYINQSVFVVAASVFFLFMILFIMLTIISNRKNRQIADIAFIDPITHGFTQLRFEIEFDSMMKNFKPFAFVSLDIKKFKLINDGYGGEGGNSALRHVYKCIQNNLMKDEFLARISADNFNIILKTTQKDEIMKRLMDIANDINAFNNQREDVYLLPITCGTYIVDSESERIVTIRDRANTARKNVQPSIEQPICTNAFYMDMDRLNMIKEKEIENAMKKALENHEFVVYLQPKIDLKTHKIVAAEALVRWLHPQKGLIPPDEFIPLFERNGFILKLDMFVFEEVCRYIHKWLHEGTSIIPISVNLSRNHLYQMEFLNSYKRIQNMYDVPSECLEIELTETVVFENLELLKQVIDKIHELGYLCSMDDFGSGYSSLNVLKEVPVDILKIDKIFFDRGNNYRGNNVVESIIQLAQKLGMKTVAEGVETQEQLTLLETMGCDMVQGYIFYKPMPVTEFETIIETCKE